MPSFSLVSALAVVVVFRGQPQILVVAPRQSCLARPSIFSICSRVTVKVSVFASSCILGGLLLFLRSRGLRLLLGGLGLLLFCLSLLRAFLTPPLPWAEARCFPNIRAQAVGKVAQPCGHGGVIHSRGADHTNQSAHLVADIIAGDDHAACRCSASFTFSGPMRIFSGRVVLGNREILLVVHKEASSGRAPLSSVRGTPGIFRIWLAPVVNTSFLAASSRISAA